MIARRALFVLLVLITDSCQKESFPRFAFCLNSLAACNNGNGQFCTFGFKFGDSNPFTPAGMEVPGPGVGATTISYSFMDGGTSFSTSAEDGLVSRQFSDSEKSKVRDIIAEWESAANIAFLEVAPTTKANITIVLADIQQGGIGHPNFIGEPCSQIAGFLVLSNKTSSRHNITIHELGHVLGLGHVVSNNVMNPNQLYDHLQPGDIEGLQSIYGPK